MNHRITEEDVDLKFKDFLKNCHRCKTEDDKKLLEKAFKFAKIAHQGQTRYNGDAFINHPLEVAKIVTIDIGLSAISAAAAMLHDTLTNSEDIDSSFFKISFGKKEAKEIIYLVNKLTKIKGTSNYFDTDKLVVYKQVVESLSEDIRIIYIKIADRLHNMRTLDALEPHRKLKVANETMYVYAPLADRLGLYNIKTELQDLAFKYLQPKNHSIIALRIKDDKWRNIMKLNRFALPIIYELTKAKIDFEIKSRQKSIYSIWQKTKRKKISIEEVYDIFAIRIVFNPKPENSEIEDSFVIANIIKNIYENKPDRTRNWIDQPKSNGYTALHITVKDQFGKWVEVQIRSKQMDDIAEHGLAAHWKYKGLEARKEEFDRKINDLKKKFENIDPEEINYSKDFKLLFTTELYVYTPKGKEITLDVGATVLDFAFAIHSNLGLHCVGAKVNNVLKPIDYKLQSGDEVFIITLRNQTPKKEWIDIAVTSKTKNYLKEYFKSELIDEKELGQTILNEVLEEYKTQPSSELFHHLRNYFQQNKRNLYINIGNSKIDKEQLKAAIKKFNKWKIRNFFKPTLSKENIELNSKNFIISKCCNPIPGDEVVGITTNENIVIHRKNCNELSKIEEAKKQFSLTWKMYRAKSFYTRLEIEAENQMGIFYKISRVLSKDLEVNIKSLHFETLDDEFIMSGWLEIFVLNKEHLNKIIAEIKEIFGVIKVERLLEI
ncbi:MAG: bifunctional (p)ppGpp synthetase/guanosine-3',5'-bis(diphosphate) 3'-pyrophosphohydrolase [Bacteroidales bacterium]|nr:bifunctional (p)ppGpp synthetase/guanosine-3',5'-bis(diphosphate) 3'-pyrophosphohydrolase [Bacteroidales bacterium]